MARIPTAAPLQPAAPDSAARGSITDMPDRPEATTHSASFAADVVRRLDRNLSRQLDQIDAAHPHGPRTPRTSNAGDRRPESQRAAAEAPGPVARLPDTPGASAKLPSRVQLAHQLHQWYRAVGLPDSTLQEPNEATVQSPPSPLLLLHPGTRDDADAGGASADDAAASLLRLVHAAHAPVIDALLDEANAVAERADHWAALDEEWTLAASYFVQTLPARLCRLAAASLQLLDQRLLHSGATGLDESPSSQPGQNAGVVTAQTTTTTVGGLAARRTSDRQQALIATWRTLRNSPTFVLHALFPLSVRASPRSLLLAASSPDARVAQLFAAWRTPQAASSSPRPSLLSTLDVDDDVGGERGRGGGTARRRASPSLSSLGRDVAALSPVHLTRHEARTKQAMLLARRDDLAVRLGELVGDMERIQQQQQRRSHGSYSTTSTASKTRADAWEELLASAAAQLRQLHRAVRVGCVGGKGDAEDVNDDGGATDASPSRTAAAAATAGFDAPEPALASLATSLHSLLHEALPRREASSRTLLGASALGLGPSPWYVRAWPTLLLAPTLGLAAARLASRNWDAVLGRVAEAREAVRGLLVNWVYEPALRLVDTLRAGAGGEGDVASMIVSRESLNSDLQSLERMVTSFSADQYQLSGEELERVSSRVREGDLTPVLRVYESELRSPLRSAVSGNLVRALLIQVQKAKVDLEVAMVGIDRLLGSQQLLFGAVGLAPAMLLLWVGVRATRAWVQGAVGLGGGKARRRRDAARARLRAWEAMRRIDRLVSRPPRPSTSASAAATLAAKRMGAEVRGEPTPSSSSSPVPPSPPPLDALTRGLLLLELSLLRSVAPALLTQVRGAQGGGGGALARRLRAHLLDDIRELEMADANEDDDEAALGSGAGDDGGEVVGSGEGEPRPKQSGAIGSVTQRSATSPSTSSSVAAAAAWRRSVVRRMWSSWGPLVQLDVVPLSA